jgi:cellulose synthase/poly-beta-1,6-N-acetylglucosamine synthase-like glycosyltransferase
MIATAIIILTSLYALEIVWLTAGLFRAGRYERNDRYEPVVSIIVAARNEEQYIEACLRSLIAVDYPPEKLEIIIVNDCSTDRTAEILTSFQDLPGVGVISTIPGNGTLLGKANALTAGIHRSTGDIIMLTDADCSVPPSWVRETVRYFTPETGIVGGYTLLQTENAFSGMQALDWFFLFNLASATAAWRYPLTVIGNNFAIRRSAYEATGGYEAIPFSVTEDYALVRSMLRKSRFRVVFPLDARCLVRSHPCKNASHLFRQKQRWGVGGLDMIFGGMLIMAVSWLARFALLAGLWSGTYPALFAALPVMLACDLVFLLLPARRFGAGGLFRYFLQFELYLSLYALAIPFIALFSRDVIWKHRRL